jgi:Ice-binding-like/PEP-CTERM motif
VRVCEVKVVSMKLMRRVSTFVLCAAVAALFQIATAPNAFAGPILGSDLASFAILGGAGVAINGTGSVITGSVGGCCNATAVTGVIPTNFTISGGTVQMGGSVATLAQGELTTAISALSGLGPGTPDPLLGGLTLGPGVYSSSSTMGLTGTLNLNGGGNANAFWVFLVGSSLTTASSSVVNVFNTGPGAGVYWVMGAGSATLGSNSTFAGNILANQSITLGTNVTDPCGRLLTQVASVTLAGTDTIGIGCSGILAGSNGLSGGGTLTGGVVTPLPFAPIPEPGTVVLLGAGIACLVARRPRRHSGRR